MQLFLIGILVTLTPSALIMAWLLWQAEDGDFDFHRPRSRFDLRSSREH
jgi:hypothetical protein